jgi:uncharacterized protein (TIGR04141 family)
MDQHLTAYHIKDEFADKDFGGKAKENNENSLKSLLRDRDNLVSRNLTKEMRGAINPEKFRGKSFKAKLFVLKAKKRSELKQPDWVKFLKEGFGTLALVPKTQSASAVLFVGITEEEEGEEKKELFAFTFGGGRYLLKPKVYEIDYGLRVALNVIYDYPRKDAKPNRLRSVSSKTIAANTIRTRKQVDRQVAFEVFGVDTWQDTLTAVTGTSTKDKGLWCRPLSGSECLSTTPNIEFIKLGHYCHQIIEAYKKKTYEDDFGWIKNRRPVKGVGLLNALKAKLAKSIKAGSDKIALAIPEMMEFADVGYFYLSFNDKDRFWDLGGVSLKEKSEAAGINKNDWDKKNLEKGWRLVIKDAYSNDEKGWPLLDCLSGEVKLGGKTYILSEGEFYEVDKDFLKRLNLFIKSVPDTTVKLPACPAGLKEEEYNKYAAKKKGYLLLMDQKNVRIPGRTTAVEVCDLLTNDHCFVHVKRKLESSMLSHLFAQGYTSAELFSDSPEYRERALNRVKKQEIEKTKPKPKKAMGPHPYVDDFATWFSEFDPGSTERMKYEVSYAIIADWKGKSFVDALPFFSKITLRKYARELMARGYRVTVACIGIGKPLKRSLVQTKAKAGPSQAVKKAPKSKKKAEKRREKVEVGVGG